MSIFPTIVTTRLLCLLLGMLLIGSCVVPSNQARLSDAEIAVRLGSMAPLTPLFAALFDRQSGGAAVVRVLQVGDSHTANDAFSGRLRELFQNSFGDGGRGLLPPGIPYRYYRPARVEVAAQGWTLVPSADPRSGGPFGLAGVRQHADGPAFMTLSALGHGDLGFAEVEFLRQPGGGTLALDQGQVAPSLISTGGALGAVWAVAPRNADSMEFTVRTIGDGPVDLLAWSASRVTAGVTYSNLGTIGASVTLLDRWDGSIVRQELARMPPQLIMIAFGTNEGFRDGTDPQSYRTIFADRLRSLKAAAPQAALLVAGPPDGARHRSQAGAEAGDCGDPNWITPPRLASVREAQRLAAQDEGAFFWDWQAAMGGACSMLRWASASPPLAAADHVHLLSVGYRQSAEALFDVIMKGYTRYRVLRGSPERPAS